MKLRRLSNLLICALLASGVTVALTSLGGEAGSSAWCIEWQVIQLASLVITLPLLFDVHSLSFLAAVATIALAVMVFSSSYMSGDVNFIRFHLLVMGFVFSMLLLIVCPNLVSLLLGWDGLGVTSYLLVIYFQNQKANGAGMITALTNRVGDVLILMSVALLAYGGSWGFWWPLNSSAEWGVVGGLLLLAASTKSAQVPFSAWLPAAMAAPTPVSSLVHSSTLVTAGVYLLFRMGPALAAASLLNWVFTVGVATMLMASVSALYETDMKKIVALSTLSQLGLMFTALGLGAFKLAFFHLLAHAFFKALLFVSVGSLIHLSSDYQDLRKIGLCAKSLPASLSFSVVANMSLMGLPFMAGFYSKDLMLETMSGLVFPLLTWLVYYFSVMLTALYSIRFVYLVTLSPPQGATVTVGEDSDPLMGASGFILWPLACGGGASLLPLLITTPEVVSLPLEVKNLTLLLITAGVMFSCLLPNTGKPLPSLGWTWGALWGLPYFSSSMCPAPLTLGTSLRLSDLGWGKVALLSTATSISPAQEHPAPGSRAYVFLPMAALALAVLWALYLCVMKLIISFKLKT